MTDYEAGKRDGMRETLNKELKSSAMRIAILEEDLERELIRLASNIYMDVETLKNICAFLKTEDIIDKYTNIIVQGDTATVAAVALVAYNLKKNIFYAI